MLPRGTRYKDCDVKAVARKGGEPTAEPSLHDWVEGKNERYENSVVVRMKRCRGDEHLLACNDTVQIGVYQSFVQVLALRRHTLGLFL